MQQELDLIMNGTPDPGGREPVGIITAQDVVDARLEHFRWPRYFGLDLAYGPDRTATLEIKKETHDEPNNRIDRDDPAVD
jgi:hypothetical protein